jgi:mono/diheme cytochrome c family protein
VIRVRADRFAAACLIAPVVVVVLVVFAAFGGSLLGAQGAARTTNDPLFTAAQATRGEALYLERCAACHGQALAGMEAAPALAGPGFSASWTGTPLGDLFERIRISMPQDKPGSLSRPQTADIVAYILSYNKAPAGQAELPPDADALKTVTIAAGR